MEWETVCRVCLQQGDIVSLFDFDENNEILRDKYSSCCEITVDEKEPYPTNICLTCVDRLLSAYQFRQQCIVSYQTLRECILEIEGSKVENTAGTEVITIKQENGVLLQYTIPVEKEVDTPWEEQKTVTARRTRRKPKRFDNYVTEKLLQPKLEREDLDEEEQPAEYDSSRPASPAQPEDDFGEDDDQDSDFVPLPGEVELDEEGNEKNTASPVKTRIKKQTFENLLTDDGSPVVPRKRGRPRKEGVPVVVKKKRKREEVEQIDGEDLLLKETLMANTEPMLIVNKLTKAKMLGQPGKRRPPAQNKHICDQCGASFKSNFVLQNHIKRHLGIKEYACTLCSAAFVQQLELKRHMVRHTGIKPHKCSVCSRSFSTLGSRQRHELLHFGVKPFQCNICGKKFTYSQVLTNHMLTHTGEKNYECAPCNKRFTKFHHLKCHNKVHHKEVYLQQMQESEARRIKHYDLSELPDDCKEEMLQLSQDLINRSLLAPPPPVSMKLIQADTTQEIIEDMEMEEVSQGRIKILSVQNYGQDIYIKEEVEIPKSNVNTTNTAMPKVTVIRN